MSQKGPRISRSEAKLDTLNLLQCLRRERLAPAVVELRLCCAGFVSASVPVCGLGYSVQPP
jgi:hypothetical protein